MALELLTDFGLGRNRRDDMSMHDGVDIESGSAAQNGNAVALKNGADRALGEALVTCNGKGALRRGDIEQMVGDAAHLPLGNFPRAEVKPCVDLARIGRYDFGSGHSAGRRVLFDMSCDRDGKIGFAG